MIRVIGGIYKGKQLKRVLSRRVRPMPNKLKEVLFSIIQKDVVGSVFLDGFAGTGSVGIEALSRGASSVCFVDELPASVKVLKENLARCGAEDKSTIIPKEFNRAVIQLSREKAEFDIIFLDPPYRLLDERDPLKVIMKRDILGEEGTIILRRHFKTPYEARFFILDRQIRIGDDALSFYSKQKE